MKKTVSFFALFVILVLAGCNPGPGDRDITASSEAQVNIAPTEAVEVVPTDTATPMPSDTPLPTDTPTLTPSPSSTNTPEPTPVQTETPVPTVTPTPKPSLIVEIASINIRSGPGTAYEVAGVAVQGEVLIVSGQFSDCHWLQVETASGDPGWVSGSSDYVSLNLACSAIPLADIPPLPVVTTTSPAAATQPAATEHAVPAGGTGRITVINETPDRGASVFLRTCCESIQISTEPGETKVVDLPADEYAWHVQHHNCERYFPQLFLTDGMEVIVRFVPIETGCGLAVEVTIIGGQQPDLS